jgi:hypothetical protein
MAKNRAIYGWDKPKAPPKPKKEMPFKATHRHEYWSIDVRYIEHHQLPNIKGPVYVISILENFSRMLLASAISERQDTAAYLWVLGFSFTQLWCSRGHCDRWGRHFLLQSCNGD